MKMKIIREQRPSTAKQIEKFQVLSLLALAIAQSAYFRVLHRKMKMKRKRGENAESNQQ